MKKKIILNCVVFILILFVLEVISVLFYAYNRCNFESIDNNLNMFSKLKAQYGKLFKADFNFNEDFDSQFRENEYGNNDKGGIVLLGCSYTYGEDIDETQTISHILSKYTGRNVYNLGLSGGGPKEALYILRDNEILNNKTNYDTNIDYVFYIYITSHINRVMYGQFRFISPVFVEKNNKLEYSRVRTFLNSLSKLHYFIMEFLTGSLDSKYKFKKFVPYILEINNEVKRLYPNAQFIILVYEKGNEADFSVFDKYNIKHIDLNELTGIQLNSIEYRISETNLHPTEKAWQLVVPKLAKELNL